MSTVKERQSLLLKVRNPALLCAESGLPVAFAPHVSLRSCDCSFTAMNPAHALSDAPLISVCCGPHLTAAAPALCSPPTPKDHHTSPFSPPYSSQVFMIRAHGALDSMCCFPFGRHWAPSFGAQWATLLGGMVKRSWAWCQKIFHFGPSSPTHLLAGRFQQVSILLTPVASCQIRSGDHCMYPS